MIIIRKATQKQAITAIKSGNFSEVNRIKEQMEDVSVTDKAGMSFFEGKWNGNDVVVVRSGIGKVNAAVCAQILADTFHAK